MSFFKRRGRFCTFHVMNLLLITHVANLGEKADFRPLMAGRYIGRVGEGVYC